MCWCSYTEEKPHYKIAKEDIPVYKVVRKEEDYYRPWYIANGTRYQPGEEYMVVMEAPYPDPMDFKKSYIMKYGFHSYDCTKTRLESKDISYYIFTRWDCLIDSYHKFGGKTVVIDCVIPKGARYYVNTRGEYVSNRIKILNEVKEHRTDYDKEKD